MVLEKLLVCRGCFATWEGRDGNAVGFNSALGVSPNLLTAHLPALFVSTVQSVAVCLLEPYGRNFWAFL